MKDILKVNYYPNPFNHSITISLNEEAKGEVVGEIFDITGKAIRKLKSENGILIWDGKDDNNRECSVGSYFVDLTTNGKRASSKILKQ